MEKITAINDVINSFVWGKGVSAAICIGGAMYYLQDDLGGKKGMKTVGKILAVVFSIFAMLASFGIGSMGQVNKIVLNIESAFPVASLSDNIVLGWSHYGSKAWEYIFGAKTTVVYKLIHVAITVFGAVLSSSLAWDISDTFNGLMMLPNLIGVLVMSGLVMRITKNYIDRRKKGDDVEPVISFDPAIQAEQAAKLKNNSEL